MRMVNFRVEESGPSLEEGDKGGRGVLEIRTRVKDQYLLGFSYITPESLNSEC